MGEWKGSRQRGQGLHQKDDGWPARPRRPPPSPNHSGYTVPRWERQFCSQIRWNDFCEKKKIIHIFPKVLDWDDSAGKDAFDNAKACYWAEINGLSYDILSPDPDMFIDVVDQDAFLDPKLVEDLYRQPPPPVQEVLDYNSVKIIPTGWDVEFPSPTDFLPKFISAGPTFCEKEPDSATNNIVDHSAKIRPMEQDDAQNLIDSNNASCEFINTIPTGWDDAQNQIDSNDISYGMINVPPTGWGDDHNPISSNNNSYESVQMISTGWGDAQDPVEIKNTGYGSNKIVPTGWGDVVESGDCSSVENSNGNSWVHGMTRSARRTRRKQGSRNCFGSNHRDARCQGQGYQTNGNWNEFNWRKKYGGERHPLDFGFSYAPVFH